MGKKRKRLLASLGALVAALMALSSMPAFLDRAADVATIVAALSAAVVTGVVVFRGPPQPAASAVTVVEDWERYVQGGHRIGPDDAAVPILEFGDYQCPFCKAAEPHLGAILQRYDDVALVYRHLPLANLHPFAYAAASAAECAAEQDAFWPFHRLLFETDGWATLEPASVYDELATKAGVEDRERFSACLAVTDPADTIEADLAAAAALGFTGTPTFVVNGTTYRGLIDSLRFEAVYQEAIR
jgi:protein-disulfide isomerase